MRLRRLAIENVRSFLDKREIDFEGPMTIVIGPNGGGKTNLLDIANTMLRRYLFATRYLLPNEDRGKVRWEPRHNDQLNNMHLENHALGEGMNQCIEIDVEVSQSDLENMWAIKDEADEILLLSKRSLTSNPWELTKGWEIGNISPGDRFTYVWQDNSLRSPESSAARHFLEYLQLYELDNSMRALVGKAALRLSVVYLPVNRAANGFQSSLQLAGYKDEDQKRSFDAISSRSGANIIGLAIGRLAQKFRLLQENDNVSARAQFAKDPNLIELTADLKELGYEWELVTVDALSNQYDIRLQKQGTSFLVGAASSGERELLTYLFAIYALNLRDALIIVDEPELHLHPRWQTTLLALFIKLANSTGNQFLLATHSPTFISPVSIRYVSRVFIENQRSNVRRLDASGLPNAKHLFNLVNSQNNEKIFFSDKVVLVEGISDRIVFERLFETLGAIAGKPRDPNVEIVSVGGKGFFSAYQQLLGSFGVRCAIVADLDYVEQIGRASIKALFRLNETEVKKDVVDNVKSTDGAALVAAIENAIQFGTWDQAKQVWEYIKSKRTILKSDLNLEETNALEDFLLEMEGESIFILKRGALEDYLPAGFRGKDLAKLIDLVASDNFLDALPPEPRYELEAVARKLLDLPAAAASVSKQDA